MVISFSVKQARDFLFQFGYVYTFRKDRRKRVGKDWMNLGRCKPKVADVFITEVGQAFPYSFDDHMFYQHVTQSGFTTTEEWLSEVKRLHGKLPRMGWLYKVEIQHHG